MQRFKLFSGSSHEKLAREIAAELEIELGGRKISRFPDGEIAVELGESVRGCEVFVLQSVAGKPNQYLMELLIIVDALKRASARKIIPVIPYFGYARQDRRGTERVPITAKLVADLLQSAGASRVLTMDLHAEQIQGFFNIPVDNLLARPVLVKGVRELGLSKPIIVSPDAGSVKIARNFAASMGSDYAIVDKRRLSDEEVEVTTIIGDVQGRDVVLTDDVVSTAGTLMAAARACQGAGANRVFAAVSHGLFVGEALSRIEASPIAQVLVTNSVPGVDARSRECEKIQETSVAGLFGEAIRRILSDRSISSLFVN